MTFISFFFIIFHFDASPFVLTSLNFFLFFFCNMYTHIFGRGWEESSLLTAFALCHCWGLRLSSIVWENLEGLAFVHVKFVRLCVSLVLAALIEG